MAVAADRGELVRFWSGNTSETQNTDAHMHSYRAAELHAAFMESESMLSFKMFVLPV